MRRNRPAGAVWCNTQQDFIASHSINGTFEFVVLNPKMIHCPSIERLGCSEVVINHLALSIHQSSELIQLAAGNFKRGLEVDPFDHLKASWGGQAALVCAVSGVSRGHHRVNEGVKLEAGPGEGDLAPGAGDLAQCVREGLQRRVLSLKIMTVTTWGLSCQYFRHLLRSEPK